MITDNPIPQLGFGSEVQLTVLAFRCRPKPLILSTGMSSMEEIQITVDFLNERKAKFALLHCNSTYPAHFMILILIGSKI